MIVRSSFFIIILFLFIGCKVSNTSKKVFDPDVEPVTKGSWFKPQKDSSWQWQLIGNVNISYDVDIYDIDLFDTDVKTIRKLKSQGKKVICYFSAGSFEDWRQDKDKFPKELLGNGVDGWAGERWLDISNDKLAPIMIARLDLAVKKGCDGVEPDNVDGYLNDTGFDLTSKDQLGYNKFIANEARKRGLSVALKNDLEQIEELEPYFDFAINEQCHIFNECDFLIPFLEAGKPVFNAEYDDIYRYNTNGVRDTMCSYSIYLGIKTLVLPLDLDDSFRISCDD
jgi:hypothetical protein